MINSGQDLNKIVTICNGDDMSTDAFIEMVEGWKHLKLRSNNVVSNVTKTKTEEFQVAAKGKRGSHWSCVFIDFQNNKIIYCDFIILFRHYFRLAIGYS